MGNFKIFPNGLLYILNPYFLTTILNSTMEHKNKLSSPNKKTKDHIRTGKLQRNTHIECLKSPKVPGMRASKHVNLKTT